VQRVVGCAAGCGIRTADADLGFLEGFDAVLVVGRSLESLAAFDAAARKHRVAFYGAASRGTTSFFFADLHRYEVPLLTGMRIPLAAAK
jgi:hypothetical protein